MPDREILVIQGNRDSTVQWKHNLSLLRSRLPHAEFVMVHGARHEMFNEEQSLRREAQGQIVRYLQRNAGSGPCHTDTAMVKCRPSCDGIDGVPLVGRVQR